MLKDTARWINRNAWIGENDDAAWRKLAAIGAEGAQDGGVVRVQRIVVGAGDDAEVEAEAMRQELVNVLNTEIPGRNFDYLLQQRGMFSYTGFSAAQVDRLRDEFGVYLIASGRMCVAGLNSRNVQQVAKAFAAVM